MITEIVVHAPHLVDINGWRFNFRAMIAERIKPQSNNRNVVGLIYCEDKGCITSPAQDLKDMNQPTTSNYGTWDWNTWFSFFTPPEQGYNRLIDEAYQTYLFEKSLLS